MNVFKLHALLIFSSSILALIAQSFVRNNPEFLMLSGGIVCVSWIVTESSTPLCISRAISRVLSVIAFFWSISSVQIEIEQILRCLGEFISWVLVIKMYERRNSDIEVQRILLSMLCFVMAAIQANSLVFLGLLILWSLVAVCFLMTYRIVSECRVAENRWHQNKKEIVSVANYRYMNMVGFRYGFLKTFGAIAFLATLLAVFLFVFLPRGSGESFSRSARQEVGDLSTIRLSTGQNIGVSREQVATVSFVQPNGEVLPRFKQPIRLRSATLEYKPETGIWGSTVSNDNKETESFFSRFAAQKEIVSDAIIQKTTLMRSLAQLPLGGTPLRITTFPKTNFIINGDSGTCSVQDLQAVPRQYEAVVLPGIFSESPLPSSLSGKALYSNEVVFEITKKILLSAGIGQSVEVENYFDFNRDSANAIKNWFRTGSFTYTTNLFFDIGESGVSVDPVEKFLTIDRRGHCEFFATAMSAMLSTISVPSRVVTGFVTDQYEEKEGYYLVSASNAHSWVEVATGFNEWSVFDPTPAAGNPELVSRKISWKDQIVWRYRKFESWFQIMVLGYDTNIQMGLLSKLDPRWEVKYQSVKENIFQLRSKIFGYFSTTKNKYYWIFLMTLSLIILIIVSIVWYARRRQIYWSLLKNSKKKHFPGKIHEIIFYADALSLCRRLGWVRKADQTFLAFSRDIEKENPIFGKKMIELTEAFYQVRFGKKKFNSLQKHYFESIVQDLKGIR